MIKPFYLKTLLTILELSLCNLGFAINPFSSAASGLLDMQQLALILEETRKHIKETRRIVKATHEVSEIMKNPKESILAVKDLGDAVDQLDKIFKTQQSRDLKRLHKSIGDLDSELDRLKYDSQSIMIIGGKKKKRSYKLYEVYRKMNDLYKDYDETLKIDTKIQEKERNRQKNLYNQLNKTGGITPDEKEQIALAIEASKGIQKASANEITKATQRLEQEYRSKKIGDDLEAELQWEEYKENLKYENEVNQKQDREDLENLQNLIFNEKSYNKHINIK